MWSLICLPYRIVAPAMHHLENQRLQLRLSDTLRLKRCGLGGYNRRFSFQALASALLAFTLGQLLIDSKILRVFRPPLRANAQINRRRSRDFRRFLSLTLSIALHWYRARLVASGERVQRPVRRLVSHNSLARKCPLKLCWRRIVIEKLPMSCG